MTTHANEKQMKTVTLFVGSGRKTRGTTFKAARLLLDNLEAHGDVRGEIVFLCDYDLGLCRGCKVCFERGEERCPLRGDRDRLIEKMMDSDGVVFASPNYSFQVSAVMKAFLDRLGFLFHRPRFHGKTFTSVVVQGNYGASKILKYLEFVGSGLGFNVVKGSCVTALEPLTDKDRKKMERAIAGQSHRFYDRLSRPVFAPPSLFQLMVFRMARTSIEAQIDDGNRDHDYYRDRGWFDSDYYYPTKLSPLKKAIGALFDRVFGRLYARTEPAPLADQELNAGATSSR